MQAKTGHEIPGNAKGLQNDQQTKKTMKSGKELGLEPVSTNQVVGSNKATIHSELSSVRWHLEMPAKQNKAGVTSHTLHERRPQNNKDTPQNSQTDYTQQTEQQRESLDEEIQDTRLGEVTGWQKISEPTLQGTKTLSPDPLFVASYRGEDCREAMASTTLREHRERMQIHKGDWHQAKHQVEQLI